MFYKKKIVFFITLYLMSAFCFFLANERILTVVGMRKNFFVGSGAVFGAVFAACLLLALIVYFPFSWFYKAVCKIRKKEPKKIFGKTTWALLTIFSYGAIFAVFYWITKY